MTFSRQYFLKSFFSNEGQYTKTLLQKPTITHCATVGELKRIKLDGKVDKKIFKKMAEIDSKRIN